MSDTITLENDQWSKKELTDGQREQRQSAALIPFGENGTSPENFAQLVDFAKHMASAKGMLGPHFIGNYGGCLAIIELAEQFHMKPFMLARQTYFVNNMIAFDGQAIMSMMNLHLKLEATEDGKKGQLQYEFFGDKGLYEPVEIEERDRNDMPTGKKVWVSKLIKPSTRWVRVTGTRENEATPRVYESPPVFQIKNKKSPLWEEDEDQQLIYWASRRWQRRHWPEGLLGIIDREEAQQMHIGADNAKLIDQKPGEALLERLANAKAQTEVDGPREGFTKDHALNETDPNQRKSADNYVFEKQTAKETAPVKAESSPEPVAAADREEPAPGTKSKRKKGDAAKEPPVEQAAEQEPEHEVLPKTPGEWKVYAANWINTDPVDTLQKRWDSERKLRNACGVDESFRADVFELMNNRIHDAK